MKKKFNHEKTTYNLNMMRCRKASTGLFPCIKDDFESNIVYVIQIWFNNFA